MFPTLRAMRPGLTKRRLWAPALLVTLLVALAVWAFQFRRFEYVGDVKVEYLTEFERVIRSHEEVFRFGSVQGGYIRVSVLEDDTGLGNWALDQLERRHRGSVSFKTHPEQ